MSDQDDKKNHMLEIGAVVILGFATVLGAFAAYQSSLWGGNCLTAYNQGTNKLGDANRELLRGVQESSFDTMIWLENLKAGQMEEQAEELAAAEEEEGQEEPAGEEAAGGEQEQEVAVSLKARANPKDHDQEQDRAPAASQESIESRAKAIVSDLVYADDLSLKQKLDKLQRTRRDLQDAIKWTHKTYKKRMATIDQKGKRDLAMTIIKFEDQQDGIVAKQMSLLKGIGITEDDLDDDEKVADAFVANPKVLEQYDTMDREWQEVQTNIDREYEKISRPNFFESPEYVKKKELAYKSLLAEGNALIKNGQNYNGIGDQFTLMTVLFTVCMFFAGMATIMRRFPMRAGFLVMSIAVMGYTLIQMSGLPLA